MTETVDDFALALDALRQVTALVELARKLKRLRGTGTIACPKCQGLLTYSFDHHGRGSRPTSYVAWCATPDCIKFSGH